MNTITLNTYKIHTIVIGVVLATFVLVNLVSVSTPLLGILKFSCTIGVMGTAASLTIEGPLAGGKCQQILANPKSENINLDKPAVYVKTQSLAQSVVCEYDKGLLKYVVRDEGALKIMGNFLCQAIRP